MASTRDRLLTATAELLRHQGYAGTGVKQIVDAAGVPFGSMYHFFPEGKEELGAATVRWSGAAYGALIDLFYPPGADPVAATRDFFEGAADTLRDTGYLDACPIATVALETASTSEPIRLAAAEVFESWLAALDDRFVGLGLGEDEARALSVALFSLLEGAFVLARATRDDRPVRVAGRAAAQLVETATDRRRAPRRRGTARRRPPALVG